jgi:excisionase family DNA binding protein
MKDVLLTKEDIARELSDSDNPLSIRSVERYIHLANIKPAVKGSGRGKQAKFRRADVEKIKTAKLAAAEQREQQSTALTTTKPVAFTPVALVAEWKTALETQTKAMAAVPITAKLTLSLSEAAELSGLSKGLLLEAIHSKKLKAAIRGRGWNCKRMDLDDYIKKL